MSERDYLTIKKDKEDFYIIEKSQELTNLRFVRLLDGTKKLQMGMSTEYITYNYQGMAISRGVDIKWEDIPTVDVSEII